MPFVREAVDAVTAVAGDGTAALGVGLSCAIGVLLVLGFSLAWRQRTISARAKARRQQVSATKMVEVEAMLDGDVHAHETMMKV